MARPPVHSEPHPPDPVGGGGTPAAGGGAKQVDRRHQASLVGVAIATALLVWFALANLNNVRIDFWVVSREAPLILVIVISGLLGALITALVMRRRSRNASRGA